MIEMKGKRNLVEALTALTRSHTLEGENIYFSESLNRNIRANSKISLSKLPPLLVITLKRFYWNFETMTRHKINDYFEFPLELDVSRFTVQRIEHESHYYQYRLCGILIHSGSAESGHYYSYIRAGERWL
jgi:ubiquitin C-terminal hydrolase